MLKRDKNSLLKAFEGSPFIPGDFQIEDTNDENGLPVFVLKYPGSPFKFIVYTSATSHQKLRYAHTSLAPDYPIVPQLLKKTWVGITAVRSALKEWLNKDLKDYVEDTQVPDLWSELANEASIQYSHEDDTSEFSVEEKRQMRRAIDNFRARLISEFSPTKEALQEIDIKLQYLTDALDRLNRFDWKGVLINTTICISATLSLDTERGKALLNIAKEVFSGVMKLLGY